MSEFNDNENNGQISLINIEDEMKKSYLDYAMSVIVSRALPDVRDGLKPVHRRIFYAMHEGGYHYNRPYRKSARIVGDVLGLYHPHGQEAIYDSMVRMAQPFSLRLPLIDGQGNFGSMDGDKPAAMRYTEARLKKVAHQLLANIDEDTIDFVPNYDNSVQEPSVLPARFPNLLVNGAGGIAVGMATNIPPHNLGELIDGCCQIVDNPQITDDELHTIIPGPDFPTGGMIMGRKGSHSAFHTGRGSVIMRCKSHYEEVRKDREAIIVTEIPYQVNKARLLEKIAELVKSGVIEGIADLRDESDKDGVRVVVELKRDANREVVLNLLHRNTPLQSSFGANMLALDHGQPKLMNVRQILTAFLKFREEVIVRRTHYRLRKSRDRAHILVGLAVAVENLDAVIKLIRAANDPQLACQQLMATEWQAENIRSYIQLVDTNFDETQSHYRLTEKQAKAILDLKLHRLTGLERDKIRQELSDIVGIIQELLDILNNRDKLLSILKQELMEIKEEYATPRKTEITDAEFEHDIEDLIQKEDMVVTVTSAGYIKRVPLSTYRAQRRGGKGRSGMTTRDEDILEKIFTVNTHTAVLFFSTFGKVYKLKTYRLPLGSPTSIGKALINILPLEKGETISTVMPLPDDEEQAENLFVMFATESGQVRRNKLSDFTYVMANGKIAMKLNEGDRLVGVEVCSENDDIMFATHYGKAIRFHVENVRVFVGRASTGVRGILLAKGDRVISMCVLKHGQFTIEERDEYIKVSNQLRREPDSAAEFVNLSQERFDEMREQEDFILAITENGFGKRTSSYEYRLSNRGGKGIVNIDTSERNGQVIGCFPVEDDQEIILVSDQGQMIRCPVHDIRVAGRSTQGVTIFKVKDKESVVSVTAVKEMFEDEEDELHENGEESSEVTVETAETPETDQKASDE